MIIIKIQGRITGDRFLKIYNSIADIPFFKIEYNLTTNRNVLSPEQVKENARLSIKKYYEKNKERIKKKRKEQYRLKSKPKPKLTDEEKKLKSKEYYEKNKEKLNQYQIEYRKKKGILPKKKLTDEERKIKQLQYKKNYYEKNKEKILKRMKNDRKNNKNG